jgi:hypothetical protein
MLLITADPGARSHFVAAWLNNKLIKPYFDVGINSYTPTVTKIHFDYNNVQAKSFQGLKIRIRPEIEKLDLHLYLFFKKAAVHKNLAPSFQTSEYSFECYEKVYQSAMHWLDHDQQVDLSLYDQVLNFSDTYNIDLMTNLYRWYNQQSPTDEQIHVMKLTNEISLPQIQHNNACRIAASVIALEQQQGLREADRQWSVEQQFQTNDDTLYQRIVDKINPIYYKTNL